MKHVKPLSKAVLGPVSGILSLLQLLVNLGIIDLGDFFKKRYSDAA
jgi:hypothetical protein